MSAPSITASVWDGLAAEPDYPLWLPGPEGSRLAMLFRRIPAGSFCMGSRDLHPAEEPRHGVEIRQEFWLGKFVVTQEEYRNVVHGLKLQAGENFDPDPSLFKGDRRPVEQVSWDGVTAWCAALQKWADLPTDIQEVRLPTETEWEYACRAGTETDYYNGDGAAALAEVGWFDDNSGSQTQPVDELILGRPERHPAGTVGMHGNVWEWCRDVWDGKAYRKRPQGWTAYEWSLADTGDDTTHWGRALKPGEDPGRVLRGGSWFDSAWRCRSGYRGRWWPRDPRRVQGFRVCLVRGPAT